MRNEAPIRIGVLRRLRRICSIAGFLALAGTAHSSAQSNQAQAPQAGSSVMLDRAVAVVNGHLILASDLDDEMRLSVLDPNQGGQNKLTAQRALDELISRTLIEQQIRQEDARADEPTQAEVDARLAEIRKVLPACVRQNCLSDSGWSTFLTSHGLTAERVEANLRYRLEILRFIEQRFRQGIQISPQQIDSYYHDVLLPQYAPGDTIPPLDQVAPVFRRFCSRGRSTSCSAAGSTICASRAMLRCLIRP